MLRSSPHSSSIVGEIRSRQKSTAWTSFSSDDFEELWDDALDDYFARTDVDLSDRDQDLYRRLQSCSSSDSVVRTLDELAVEFRAYRKGSRRSAKIRPLLSSVARGVLVLIDAGAECAASKVRSSSLHMIVD